MLRNAAPVAPSIKAPGLIVLFRSNTIGQPSVPTEIEDRGQRPKISPNKISVGIIRLLSIPILDIAGNQTSESVPLPDKTLARHP